MLLVAVCKVGSIDRKRILNKPIFSSAGEWVRHYEAILPPGPRWGTEQWLITDVVVVLDDETWDLEILRSQTDPALRLVRTSGHWVGLTNQSPASRASDQSCCRSVDTQWVWVPDAISHHQGTIPDAKLVQLSTSVNFTTRAGWWHSIVTRVVENDQSRQQTNLNYCALFWLLSQFYATNYECYHSPRPIRQADKDQLNFANVLP